MKALLRWCGCSGRGVAALEFAITLPIVLALFGAVTDFGLAFYSKSCLASAVSAGAEYAILIDQRAQTLTTANIQTVMQDALAQSLPNATVTPSAACYCVTGSSTSSWNTNVPVSCLTGTTCATGYSKYVQLTLSYNYNAMLPAYSLMSDTTTLTESAWVPLQ